MVKAIDVRYVTFISRDDDEGFQGPNPYPWYPRRMRVPKRCLIWNPNKMTIVKRKKDV
jgi:hypothetical protein